MDQFDPLAIALLIAVAGLALGFAAAWFWMNRRLAALQNHHDVNQAVLQSSLDSRNQAYENLNLTLQEIQSRLSDKESTLQKTLVSEASLTIRGDELHRGLNQAEERLGQLQQEVRDLREKDGTARARIAHLETALAEQEKQAKEKLALLEKAREQMNTEFRNLANEIFEAKQQTFKSESAEQLGNLLGPLGERIKDFEKRVETSYTAESKERFSLIREIRGLQSLNERMSQDAINLTRALKGESKTQGTWGEVILERVLEKSGLVKGREYDVQQSLKDEDGKRFQPDVVVHLPEEKDVVIDAKVSLTAYERYCSSDDGAEREAALSQHLLSVRNHVKQLAQKDYQKLDGVRSLDFVLLFIPVEAAFAEATTHDPSLFSDAFEKNIMLVAPSTLLATLRTIQNIWRYEQQNQNAQEIADRAGALYDKFVNFVGDLELIGSRLDSVQTAYQDAHNKLASGRGNLVRRAEVMKELGAKTSKSLPANLVEMPRREELPASSQGS